MQTEISVVKFFKKYIRGTIQKQTVLEETILVTELTRTVMRACGLNTTHVYINTRIIKHLYDRKPAEEFDFIIRNIGIIVKFPDLIYKNKSGKRGEFCFVKDINDLRYLCVIGNVASANNGGEDVFIVTCFRVRDSKYLKDYKVFWSWKGGDLHRNAFDASLRQSSCTPQ